MRTEPFDESYIQVIRMKILDYYHITEAELPYYFTSDQVENNAYDPRGDRILIKTKTGIPTDISVISRELNNATMPTKVIQHVLCYPKDLPA
jgi:hypothetical protein